MDTYSKAWAQRRIRRPLWVVAGISAAAVLSQMIHNQFGVGDPGLDTVFSGWVYNALQWIAAGTTLTRAVLVRENRSTWAALGIGLTCGAIGDTYYSIAFAHLPNEPFPSLADPFYLSFDIAAYICVGLLVRKQLTHFHRSIWLDGLIGFFAVAAIALVFLEQTLSGAVHESFIVTTFRIAYPVADIVLLSGIFGALAVTGWQINRSWLFLLSGLTLNGVADTIYAYQVVAGTYHRGTLLDALWPLTVLMLAVAAWQPFKSSSKHSFEGWSVLVAPILFAVVATTLLVVGEFINVPSISVVCAGITLTCVFIRMGITFQENIELADSRQLAQTDDLTGLANRRKFVADLKMKTKQATKQKNCYLLMLDLDGFKAYNDGYGHPAGDMLLKRLAVKLDAIGDSQTKAYRVGGDEFCVLSSYNRNQCNKNYMMTLIMSATAALNEQGEAFSISCSYGIVSIPEETIDPDTALQLADQRMYTYKNSRRPSPITNTRDALLKALSFREPELEQHVIDVGNLVRRVGVQLGMVGDELEITVRAAELHDVGKVAVPDAILRKCGPLTDAEWQFMHQHTIYGENILNEVPGMAAVASIVRSSHERYDGTGYPDGLAGEAIPLGARIVAVCDSFDAMTSDRPYQKVKTQAAAIAELHQCAGSQFDPAVVAAFCRAIADETVLEATITA